MRNSFFTSKVNWYLLSQRKSNCLHFCYFSDSFFLISSMILHFWTDRISDSFIFCTTDRHLRNLELLPLTDKFSQSFDPFFWTCTDLLLSLRGSLWLLEDGNLETTLPSSKCSLTPTLPSYEELLFWTLVSNSSAVCTPSTQHHNSILANYS